MAVIVWAAGAAFGAARGLWLGLGSTAIIVGAIALSLEWRQLQPMLRVRPAHVALGIGTGVAMVLATRALYVPVSNWLPFVNAETVKLYAALGTRPPAVYGLLIVPIALGEEVVWRGVVQGALQRRCNPVTAAVLAAALYAVAQVPVGVPTLTLTALACGLVWGLLRAATAGIVAPFLAHLVWDEVMFFVAPLVAP